MVVVSPLRSAVAASSPKSSPRVGTPAGTEVGKRSACFATMMPSRADSRSPSRIGMGESVGVNVPSTENQMSIPYLVNSSEKAGPPGTP